MDGCQADSRRGSASLKTSARHCASLLLLGLLSAVAHGDSETEQPALLFLATHENYAWTATKVAVAATTDGNLWSVDVPDEYCEWIACSLWTVRAYLPRNRVDAVFEKTRNLIGRIDAAQLEHISGLLDEASQEPIGAPQTCAADAGKTSLLAYFPASFYYESRLIYLGGDICMRNESTELDELQELLSVILAEHDISIPWY